METKICSKCEMEKPLDQFYHLKSSKDGHRPNCKECSKAANISWYKRKGKEWVQKHKQDPKVRERSREAAAKINKTPQRIAYMKKWREQNKHKRRIRDRERYQNDPIYRRKIISKVVKARDRVDRRINHRMGCYIREALGAKKAGRHWESLVGYTLEELIIHLEALFKPKMSWENYGEWQIDHIKPKCMFNIIDERCKDFIDCWSLSNLQPLWASENMEKGNKYEQE